MDTVTLKHAYMSLMSVLDDNGVKVDSKYDDLFNTILNTDNHDDTNEMLSALDILYQALNK